MSIAPVGAAPTVIEQDAAAWLVASVASAAETVNADVPAAVGVPEIVPVEPLSVSPAGRAPPGPDQMKVPEPPAAASDAVYHVPTWPLPAMADEIETGTTGTAIEIASVAD